MDPSSTLDPSLSSTEWIWQPHEVFEGSGPHLSGRRALATSLARGELRLEEGAHAMPTPGAVAEPGRPRRDPPVPALRAAPQMLPAGELPPLGSRLAFDLH